jgi:hypothetical protein
MEEAARSLPDATLRESLLAAAVEPGRRTAI